MLISPGSGTHIWRDFVSEKVIGRGRSGSAVLARRQLDDHCVVVKQVELEGLSEKQRVDCENEVMVLRMLCHPNILTCLDSFHTEGMLNIVTEYCEGGTLEAALLTARQEGRRLSEPRILSWFTQLADALAHMHAKRVIHRDVKTSNIFLMRAPNRLIKLGDLGVARVLSTDTFAETCIGTPYYLSPEMIQGQPYGPQSDVWSLGVVLYEMLNLERPFTGENISALAFRICEADYVDGDCASLYSPALCSAMRSMLRKDAAQRLRLDEFLASPIVMDSLPDLLGLDQLARGDGARTSSPGQSAGSRGPRRDSVSAPLVGGRDKYHLSSSWDEPGAERSESSSSGLGSSLRIWSGIQRFLPGSPLDFSAFRRPKRRPSVERGSNDPSWRHSVEDVAIESPTLARQNARPQLLDDDAMHAIEAAASEAETPRPGSAGPQQPGASTPPSGSTAGAVASARGGLRRQSLPYSYDDVCMPGAEAEIRDQSMQKKHRRLIELLLAHSLLPDATVGDLDLALGDQLAPGARIEGSGGLGVSGRHHVVRTLHWLARSLAGGALEIEEPTLSANGRETIAVFHLKELRGPPGSIPEGAVTSTEIGTKVTWEETSMASIALVIGRQTGATLRAGESAVRVAGGRRFRPRTLPAKRSAVSLSAPEGTLQRFLSGGATVGRPMAAAPAAAPPAQWARHWPNRQPQRLTPLQLPQPDHHQVALSRQARPSSPAAEHAPAVGPPTPAVRRPAFFPPPVLHVRVVSARKLNNIYLLPRPLNPYVTLRIGRVKHRTPTIYGSKAPRWVRESTDTDPYKFELPRGSVQTAELEVTIKDRNPFSKNEWLASLRLPVRSVSPATGASGEFLRMTLEMPARRFRGSDAVDKSYGTELTLELKLDDFESWWDAEEKAARVDRLTEETPSPMSESKTPVFDAARSAAYPDAAGEGAQASASAESFVARPAGPNDETQEFEPPLPVPLLPGVDDAMDISPTNSSPAIVVVPPGGAAASPASSASAAAAAVTAR